MRKLNGKPLPIFLVILPAVLQFIAWPFAHCIFRFFAHLKIEGQENLENLPKGVIFAANHAHEMDPILMRALLPMFSIHSPMFYVARQRCNYSWKGWRKIVYSEWFFKMWGAYPTYKGDKDYKLSLRNFLTLTKNKQTICIFPAGIKKIPVEDVQEVKGGVGYLARISGSLVVPVYIKGTLDISWSNMFKFQNQIHIRIGKPIYFKKITEVSTVEEYKKVAKIIWFKILDLKKVR